MRNQFTRRSEYDSMNDGADQSAVTGNNKKNRTFK